MTVVRTRRSRCADLTAWCGIHALLAGCGGGNSTFAPGTPVITCPVPAVILRYAWDQFDHADLDGRHDSEREPADAAESVDLAAPTDLAELLAVQAVPAGTYKSHVHPRLHEREHLGQRQRQAVAATAVSSSGGALATAPSPSPSIPIIRW